LQYRQIFFDLPVPMRTTPTSNAVTSTGGTVSYWEYNSQRVGYEVNTGTSGYGTVVNIDFGPELSAEL